MLITARHMQAFIDDETRRIEEGLANGISVFAPELARTIEADELKRTARLCIERGNRYALFEAPSLELYLEAMLTFGHAFDSDPLCRWARLILDLTDRGDEEYRCQKLADDMSLYLERIHGPRNEYLFESLSRLDRSADDSPKDVCSALFDLYPAKVDFVGSAAIHQLSEHSRDVALQHRIDPERGAWLLVRLMFFLGWGVADDLMYPWVSNTLVAVGIPADERTRRLQVKARTYLRAAREVLAAGAD